MDAETTQTSLALGVERTTPLASRRADSGSIKPFSTRSISLLSV